MVDITYFCIDIEASGPVPGFFNMVSLGAVPVVRRRDGRWTVGREEGVGPVCCPALKVPTRTQECFSPVLRS